MQPPLVIIVPAHNEEACLANTLVSLKACKEATVVVVADNCTDRTASIATSLGVRVLERHDGARLGKPYALAYALAILMNEGFSYFAFVDADTIVDAHFSSVIMEEFSKGADAIQVRYAHQKGDLTFWQRLLDISFTGSNTVRPLGRQYAGLSCGIFGNGFAVSRATLMAVPFQVDSIVEDLAYHLRLVRKGIKVHFTTQTTVWAVLPADAKGVQTQRSRWEGGRLATLKEEGGPLLKQICQGHFQLIEPFLDLLFPPLAIHSLIVLLLFLLPFDFVRLYAWIALGAVVFYTLVATYMHKGGWKDWAALCLAPLYLLWKITMIPHVISASQRLIWNRTERKKEPK